MDEERVFFIRSSRTSGTATVALLRRKRKSGEGINFSVGAAVAMFQGVLIGADEFKPSVYSRVGCDILPKISQVPYGQTKLEGSTPQLTTCTSAHWTLLTTLIDSISTGVRRCSEARVKTILFV